MNLSLPNKWDLCTFDDVCTPTEQVIPKEDTEFFYIDISSVDRISKKIISPQRIIGKDAPSRARKLIKTGDVIVSMTRPNLNAVALVGSEYDGQIASTGFEILRSNGVDPRWIGYLVRTNEFIDAMTSLVQGALYPAIRSKDVRAHQIPVAPLAEQRRIADKLDTTLARVDALNDRLARITPLLKRFRQSVLAAATSGRLTEDWRGTNSFTAPWLSTEIQHVAKVGTGSTPLRSNPDFFAAKGTPWITSSATSQAIIKAADEYVTEAAINAHRLKIYPIETLLVAMYGEGKTRGQVSKLGIAATINQACAAIVVDKTKINNNFLKLSLQANYLEMRVLAEGGNQPNLNLSKIKEFLVNLPSMEEQTEIVRRVETLFAFADRLEARLQSAQTAAERLTPALLAKAFRGELVPQDPSDEPATELLRRLREARAAQAPTKPKRGRKAAAAGQVAGA